MYWYPQRMWDGANVGIIGGGPSLHISDIKHLRERGYRLIGVNDAYRFGVDIDICFWGDGDWYFGNPLKKHPGHRSQVQAWPGLRVTIAPECVEEPGVLGLVRWSEPGLHPLPRLHWYQSSGLSAVALAVQLGATKVVLLGFDGKRVEGKHNWHDDNVHDVDDQVFKHHVEQSYKLIDDIKCWPNISTPSIWNCTPNSSYGSFAYAPITEVAE